MHNIPMQFFFLTRSPASRIKGAAVLTKGRKITESVPPSGTGSWYLLLYSLVGGLPMREQLCVLQLEIITALLLFARPGVCFGGVRWKRTLGVEWPPNAACLPFVCCHQDALHFRNNLGTKVTDCRLVHSVWERWWKFEADCCFGDVATRNCMICC